MPQITWSQHNQAKEVDRSVRGKVFSFLGKLQKNDESPGLHIEPIMHSKDPRVRTGRVDGFWRAILFKLQGSGPEAHYVFIGVWPHDEAILIAKQVSLDVNPVNGILELVTETRPVPLHVPDYQSVMKADERPSTPLLVELGLTPEMLIDEIGLSQEIVELAFECYNATQLAYLVEQIAPWEGVALIELSAGRSISDVKESLSIESGAPAGGGKTDEDLVAALKHPASRMQFAFIEDNEELRNVIEGGNFAAWRVFLHPEQRKYAEKSWNGSFRLSGGAGTGKTVVLLHRTRHLAKSNPGSRILLTTFNKTLADALKRDLKLLDPSIPIAENLGDPGVLVRGIDAVVNSILRAKNSDPANAVTSVLGSRTSQISNVTNQDAWKDAIQSAGKELPSDLKSPAFFKAEYELVILPARIVNLEQYAKVRRLGRKVPLDRKARMAVWAVIEAYRLKAGIAASIDFAEAAAIAADLITQRDRTLVDHVLVDEGQDLNPAHWQFLRSLVAEGKDDLFIAEDSHQRIMASKVYLGHYGINIVGRSQRLRLNYRTTAQNLMFAVGVLTGTEFVDLENEPEDTGQYRSARTGPDPILIQTTNLTEEMDRAAEIIGNWLASLSEGESSESIGILVRTEHVGEMLVRSLEERGLSTRFVQQKSMPSGKPVVMTMHRAKGMEFAKVLIFGANASTIPADFVMKNAPETELEDIMRREKSLLYVASSRARDELVVLWHGDPSSLLPGTSIK